MGWRDVITQLLFGAGSLEEESQRIETLVESTFQRDSEGLQSDNEDEGVEEGERLFQTEDAEVHQHPSLHSLGVVVASVLVELQSRVDVPHVEVAEGAFAVEELHVNLIQGIRGGQQQPRQPHCAKSHGKNDFLAILRAVS